MPGVQGELDADGACGPHVLKRSERQGACCRASGSGRSRGGRRLRAANLNGAKEARRAKKPMNKLRLRRRLRRVNAMLQ